MTNIFMKPQVLHRKDIGKMGEVLAINYLTHLGYAILAKNYKTKIGEIDIVAQDGRTLVFVEVKTRRTDKWGLPEDAVNYKKRLKLKQLAQLYIQNNRMYHKKARFDIVSIMIQKPDGYDKVRLIKNAFFTQD